MICEVIGTRGRCAARWPKMAVIAFPMGIFGKRLLLAGKGALKKKKLNKASRGWEALNP